MSHQGEALGTVRLYDPLGDSFCWGSWIIKNGAPQTCAIESTWWVYDYALEFLGFSQTHIEIRKSNRSVRLFHERFGGKKVAEFLHDDLYVIEREAIIASVSRYRRFLPSSIKVELLQVITIQLRDFETLPKGTARKSWVTHFDAHKDNERAVAFLGVSARATRARIMPTSTTRTVAPITSEPESATGSRCPTSCASSPPKRAGAVAPSAGATASD